MSGRLVVIGGGNVAMDVARTAIRLGASDVQLACLECEKDMPAHDWEIKDAKDEGVVIHPSWGPNKILGKNGKITGIELIKCTSVFDNKGKFSPKFDTCETKIIETDKVILAIGQSPDLSWIEGIDSKNEMISVDKDMQTNLPKVFAGGEVVRGPASVIEAVADGASAATAIDKFLGGDGNIYPTLTPSLKLNPYIGAVEGFGAQQR